MHSNCSPLCRSQSTLRRVNCWNQLLKMRKLQATTQCNWNWFWFGFGKETRAGTSNATHHQKWTPGKILGSTQNTHKNFLYDPFTGRRVQRPFAGVALRARASRANGERRTGNPKEGLGLMLLLSVSNLILFYTVFFLTFCSLFFSAEQQMQLFSSCGASECHDVTHRLVCLWRLCWGWKCIISTHCAVALLVVAVTVMARPHLLHPTLIIVKKSTCPIWFLLHGLAWPTFPSDFIHPMYFDNVSLISFDLKRLQWIIMKSFMSSLLYIY